VAQCLRHECADRREDERGIERGRRGLVAAAAPRRAKLARKTLTFDVAGARERVDLAALVMSDLRDDMRRGAESVDADPLGPAGLPERAIADQSGAKPGRELDIGTAGRQPKAIATVGDRAFGVAAVDRIAGEAGEVAQIFAARCAICASAA